MQQLEAATAAALGGTSAALSPAVQPLLALSLQGSTAPTAAQQVAKPSCRCMLHACAPSYIDM